MSADSNDNRSPENDIIINNDNSKCHLTKDENEKTESSESEQQLVKNYINDLLKRYKEKNEKRILHNSSNIEYPDDDFFVKLDTSIKRNTAFVKKIRNLNEANKDLIMKDLEVLNLSRYISELVTALVETKIKTNEIPIFIQICSFLHLRYQDFSSQLLDCWVKNLPRKPSDTFNAAKMRVDIKTFTELILCGIFSAKNSLPILGNLLTILTVCDKEEHKNLNIILAFCKSFCVEFAGLFPRKLKLLAEKFQLELPACDFLSFDRQKAVRGLLKDYYESLKKQISKDRKHLFHIKNDMKRNLETRGEVSNSLQEKWKIKSSELEKLHTTATAFADLIDEDIPEVDMSSLESDSMLMKTDNITAVLFDVNRFKEGSSNLWDDEETRTFYENLPDLKSLVPEMLYKDSLKDGNFKEENNIDEEDSLSQIKEQLAVVDDEAIGTDEIDFLNEYDEIENKRKDDDKNQSSSSKIRSRIFFSSLPDCVNRDLIDKAALQFATTLNTRKNRKKLVNCLFQVQRTRLDLLPFYSRLVAQLAPIMPSVASDLCVLLKKQFRHNFVKKDQVNIERKVNIVRFIGELVKFRIFPKAEVHKIFKALLSDFHHHHIEMTCNLFETCGQFLYRCHDSYHMTSLLLQQMIRLKSHMYLDSRYETMILNAFYLVTPQEKGSVRNVYSKPVVHQYLEHLIYEELNKCTISDILIKLRKIDWTNEENKKFVIRCLASSWNVKFMNLKALAHLLASLSQHHSQVVMMVLDEILENVRLGMQMNSFEYNQRRISTVKYLSECFNYDLVDAKLMFNVLYSLITFGVNYKEPQQCPLDPPFNLMRFRLVSQILQTSGLFLINRYKTRIEYFICFFQRYYWFKKTQIDPSSIDNSGVDRNALLSIDAIFKDAMFSIKPKFQIASSYEAANQQLEKRLKELAESSKDILPNTKISIRNFISDTSSNSKLVHTFDGLEPIKEDSDDETNEETNLVNNNESDLEANRMRISYSDDDSDASHNYNSDDEDENNNFDDDVSHKDSSTSDSESVEFNKAPEQIHCEEDDEFQRDLERLLNENLSARSSEMVRSNVEIVIPIERDDRKNKLDQSYSFDTQATNDNDKIQQEAKTFNFRVMTKNTKSNKPVLKTVEVPVNSDLVQNYLAQEEARKMEKENFKKLILNINKQRELEDNRCNQNDARCSQFNKFTNKKRLD